MFWKTGLPPGLSHLRGWGGGPRMRPGSDAIRDCRRGKQRGRGAVHDSAPHSEARHPRALGRQCPRVERRSGCSAEVMASDGATGHRCRNLWPDRQESPGHPGGSGHRSRSRDREKSLLRRGLREARALFHGKEGVVGSSPTEGSQKACKLALFGRHVGRTYVRADRNLWPVASSTITSLPQARHRCWVDAVEEAVTACDRTRSARAP
jgi:hypothetical protein